MNLKIEPNGDRDVYLKDNRINEIITLLLKDDTIVYDEILNLINNVYEYNQFRIQIISLIDLFQDDITLLSLFFEYCVHLKNIYKDPQCSNLRGALLEKYVYELLYLKYKNRSCLNVSCFIYIQEWKSKKSVDVLFYSSNNKIFGESFECKVNPYKIEKAHIDNLKEIFHKSNELIQPNIACFTNKNAIILKIKELKVSLGPIELFGRKNLKSIRIN